MSILFIISLSSICNAKNIMIIDAQPNIEIPIIKQKEISHGTQMTKIIATFTDDNTKIYNYVIPNIMMGCNGEIEKACRVASENNIDIICIAQGRAILKDGISYFDYELLEEFFTFIKTLASKYPNIIFCLAAGNDNALLEIENPNKNLIVTGCSDIAGDIAKFSNVGTFVDLYCLGLNIMTINNYNKPTIVSGTSFSTAFLVAEINNLLNKYPELNVNNIKDFLVAQTHEYNIYTFQTILQ